MLLDGFIPDYDFVEHHQLIAPASPKALYEAIWAMDMRQRPLIGFLLGLRELPYRLTKRDFNSKGLGYTFDDFIELGFIRLGQVPEREVVIGVVGRFWELSPELMQVPPRRFKEFSRPDIAKVATNILVTPLADGRCQLSTETRIQCLGAKAKARFGLYWLLVRVFSGLVRLEWLRLIRDQAMNRA